MAGASLKEEMLLLLIYYCPNVCRGFVVCPGFVVSFSVFPYKFWNRAKEKRAGPKVIKCIQAQLI